MLLVGPIRTHWVRTILAIVLMTLSYQNNIPEKMGFMCLFSNLGPRVSRYSTVPGDSLRPERDEQLDGDPPWLCGRASVF